MGLREKQMAPWEEDKEGEDLTGVSRVGPGTVLGVWRKSGTVKNQEGRRGGQRSPDYSSGGNVWTWPEEERKERTQWQQNIFFFPSLFLELYIHTFNLYAG